MNVVLLTVDCLRGDRVGFMGYDGGTTPFLDELAEDGVVFENAFATGPATTYSMPGLMTATYPSWFGGYPPIPDDVPTVAKVFQTAGFTTIGVHSNPWLHPSHGFDTGFDIFTDVTEGKDSGSRPSPKGKVASKKTIPRARAKLVSSLKSVFYELPEPLRRIGSQLYYTHYYAFDRTPDSAETIVNHAIDAIKGRDDNVFLWAHLMDVHRPYTFGQDSDVNLWRTARITQPGYRQPTPRDQAHITGVYDQSVAYIDQQIERLYNWFDKQMTGETVFAVTADHGEEFGEHGDWFHGKFKLYDELLHVPLIIEGSKIPNTRIEELVSLIDVGPTLLDSADLNSPDWPGCSVLPLFDSDLSCSRENIISEVYDPDRDKLAVRTKRWKLIRDNKNGRDRLYRILSNKDEKENLYPEVDIPMNLERKIKKYCEQRESITGRGINDSVKDRLEQLGYRE